MESDTLKAIEAGRYDEATRALLTRWRARPQPEIADALDLVSAKITRPPIPGGSVAERHAEWIAIAEQRDAADVPRLLQTLADTTNSKHVQARIEVLVEGGPDPRVAAALTEIVKAQSMFVSKGKFWLAVLAGLAKMKDVRQIAPLRAARPTNGRYHEDRFFTDVSNRLFHRLPRVVEQLEQLDIPRVSATDLERVTAIANTLGTQVSSEQDLLEAVLENPADDAVRLVYADSLIARGDGRGELIVMQIKRAQGEKVSATAEAKLLRAHRAAVLGPLAPVVTEPVIERGFLARCRVVVHPSQRDLVRHRWWRTLEDIATGDAELVLRDDLPLLRRVWVDDDAMLAILRGSRSVPHVRSVRLSRDFPFNAAGVADSAMFPSLTCLEIGRHGREERTARIELAKIFAGRFGENLEEIVVHSMEYDCSLELDAWRKVSKIKRVRFELPYMRATFVGNKLEVELIGGGAATALRGRLQPLKQRPEIVILKAPRGTNLDGLV